MSWNREKSTEKGAERKNFFSFFWIQWDLPLLSFLFFFSSYVFFFCYLLSFFFFLFLLFEMEETSRSIFQVGDSLVSILRIFSPFSLFSPSFSFFYSSTLVFFLILLWRNKPQGNIFPVAEARLFEDSKINS